MQIGNYQVHTLNTGFFALDGGAMFGVVPKKLWSREHPADEDNRIRMALRTLLLKSDDRVVLVDTGIGNKFPEKYQKIYGIDQGSHPLFDALAQHGVAPADVTDVVLTHLHFDHAGGATHYDSDQNLVPSFPGARHWIQSRNLEWAYHPTEKDKASYLLENVEPIKAAGLFEVRSSAGELFPGVSAWVSDGHTIGQQLVKVSDGKNTLVFCADIIPMASHLKLPYIMGYDLQPLVTLEEKRRILTQAASEDWILVFEHDPEIAACRIYQDEKGFGVRERLDF